MGVPGLGIAGLGIFGLGVDGRGINDSFAVEACPDRLPSSIAFRARFAEALGRWGLVSSAKVRQRGLAFGYAAAQLLDHPLTIGAPFRQFLDGGDRLGRAATRRTPERANRIEERQYFAMLPWFGLANAEFRGEHANLDQAVGRLHPG